MNGDKPHFFVNRILNGKKSGNLPVQEPTRFGLVINLKPVKALGLSAGVAVYAC